MTQTTATLLGWLIKEAWKKAWPSEKSSAILTINTREIQDKYSNEKVIINDCTYAINGKKHGKKYGEELEEKLRDVEERKKEAIREFDVAQTVEDKDRARGRIELYENYERLSANPHGRLEKGPWSMTGENGGLPTSRRKI